MASTATSLSCSSRCCSSSVSSAVVARCSPLAPGGASQSPSSVAAEQRERRSSSSMRAHVVSGATSKSTGLVARGSGSRLSPAGDQLIVHDWREEQEQQSSASSSSATRSTTKQQQRPLGSWPVTQRVLDDVVTMFNTMPWELDYQVDAAWVSGRIPPELRGTYLRNGPGLQVAQGKHQRHFMDGDGCVLSLAFPGGGAPPRFTNRYVRTSGFVDEQAAGKPVHRNAFTRGAADGSPFFNPLDLSFKNVANTNVLYWGGRLWALWEVGLPYELNPRTLETLGESTLGGQIKQRLAGHYRVVREPDGAQRLVAFGAQVTFTGMHLEFYELDEGGKVVASSTQPLQGFDINFIHDMLVTEHWYIVIMGPVSLDFKGFVTDYLVGKRSLAELLQYNKDRPSRVFLYPRPGKPPPAAAGPLRSHELLAPPFFSFHHVNAYERAGGAEVVVDTISWQDIAFDVTQYNIKADYYEGGCRSQLYRLVAHLPSSRVASCRRLVRRTVEFPTYATARATGRPYRFAYFAADAVDHEVSWAPAQALLKVRLPIDGEEQQQEAAQGQGHHRLTPPVWHTASAADGGEGRQGSCGSATGAVTTRQQAMNHIVPLRGAGAGAPSSTSASTTSFTSTSTSTSTSSPPSATSQHAPPTAHHPHHQHHQRTQQGPPAQQQQQEAGAGVSSGAGGEEEGVVCEEWRPGQRRFPQEPMFVPRPGGVEEDDGWIILGVHNAETMRGEVAILDAQRLSEGPVAVIHLPHALPVGLHGTWTDQYLGPDPEDASVPAWRTPHRIREL